MYLSTFVEDSVDMWYVTKSLKIDKIDDFSEIWPKSVKIDTFCQFWSILITTCQLLSMIQLTYPLSQKITKYVKIDSFDRKSPLLIKSDHFDPDLSVYILVNTH